jgi:hypothetical protein
MEYLSRIRVRMGMKVRYHKLTTCSTDWKPCFTNTIKYLNYFNVHYPHIPGIQRCPIASLNPPSNTPIVSFIPIPLAIANCSIILA